MRRAFKAEPAEWEARGTAIWDLFLKNHYLWVLVGVPEKPRSGFLLDLSIKIQSVFLRTFKSLS